MKNIDESTLSNLERSKYKILERTRNKLTEDFIEKFSGNKNCKIDNDASSMLTNQFHDNILKDLESYRANDIHLIIVDAVTILVVYKYILAFPVTIVRIKESYYWEVKRDRKLRFLSPCHCPKSFTNLIKKMIEYDCHCHLSF